MAGLESHPKPGNELTGSTRRVSVFRGGVVDSRCFTTFFDLDHHTENSCNPADFFSLSGEVVEKFHKTGIHIAGHE